MKIRIGNDIRLQVSLRFKDLDKVVNIQSIKAFFINTTLKDELDKQYKRKNRFVGRFPIEPFLDEFEPNAFAINSAGYPKYHAIVHNYYNGFGLRPNWDKCFPKRQMNITEYLAECTRTKDPNVISVIFPAEAQLYPGKYKLVIVARIYNPGYSNNSRTVTLDCNDIFELVCSSSDDTVDKPVDFTIDTNPADPEGGEGDFKDDVYVVSGTYNTDNIKLRRSDGHNVDIAIDDWYEED